MAFYKTDFESFYNTNAAGKYKSAMTFIFYNTFKKTWFKISILLLIHCQWWKLELVKVLALG